MVEVVVVTAVDAVFEHTSRDVDACRGRSTGSIGGGGTGCRTSDGVVVEVGEWILLHIRLLLPLLDGNTNINSSSSSRSGGNGIAMCLLIVWSL